MPILNEARGTERVELWLPSDLVAKLNLLCYDPLRQKTKRGKRNEIVAALLRQYFLNLEQENVNVQPVVPSAEQPGRPAVQAVHAVPDDSAAGGESGSDSSPDLVTVPSAGSVADLGIKLINTYNPFDYELPSEDESY